MRTGFAPALHRLVLGTRKIAGLGALYRATYQGACSISAASFFRLPRMRGVYLHRGLSRGVCDPGISDIDLILVREPGLPLEEERPWLSVAAVRSSRLKKVFPMLGDLWICDSSELESYLRWGGLRSWEDSPEWKLLRGDVQSLPPSDESSLKRRWLDPWVWLFVDYMDLSRRVFCPSNEPPLKREAELWKLYWDVCRYSEFILEEKPGGFPASRMAIRERIPDRPGRAPRELWLDASLRLARASRRVLERTASPRTASLAIPRIEDRAVLSGLGGLDALVAFDAPYHSYLVLPESAGEAEFARAGERLTGVALPGVPLVLDPASWALALQSSYLGTPLGWLGSEGTSATESGGIFDGWGLSASAQAPDVPLLFPELSWQIAAEAASWMALWWRYLWIAPGWSNRFVLFHLYTRSIGMRLNLRGAPSGPLSDWQLLLARAAAVFPNEARSFARIRRLVLQEGTASLDSTIRERLSERHLGEIAEQMAALQAALARSPVVEKS